MDRHQLTGLSVLVTRPERQAKQLIHAIESMGGEAIAFPTIEIKPSEALAAAKTASDGLSAFDKIIFVSENAVTFAVSLIEHDLSKAPPNYYAIGERTAGKLAEQILHGSLEVNYPKSNPTSEGLLALPEFANEDITGQKIIIFKGEGGRNYLQQALAKKKALVTTVNVYKRCCPDYSELTVRQVWQHEPNLIVATSATIIENLSRLVPLDLHTVLFATPMLVSSQRLKDIASKIGFTSCFMAKTALADDLVEAMIELNQKRQQS